MNKKLEKNGKNIWKPARTAPRAGEMIYADFQDVATVKRVYWNEATQRWLGDSMNYYAQLDMVRWTAVSH